jgi:transcriptional regulator with XRE-family HTH domain
MLGAALHSVKTLAKHGLAAHHVVMPYTRAVEIWRRIEEARRLGGLSKAELARCTGVSRATASQWEGHGSRAIARPSWDSLKLIASACSVDFNWLATGLGSPTGRSDAVFTEEELDLLYALTQLPPELRRPLEEQIRALAAALSDTRKPPTPIPEKKG